MTIFKNIKQDSKQSTTRVDRSEKTVQEGHGEKVPDKPPPQYTKFPSKDNSKDSLPNNNTTYPLLTKSAQKSERAQRHRLRWVLMEIIEITFSKDCQRLKEALVKFAPPWPVTAHIRDSSSIVNAEGRAIIVELSALIQNLQKEMDNGRWLFLPRREKEIVLEPVKFLNLNLDYVLEVLGRYKSVEGSRTPESTLVDYWKSSSSSTDLCDTIASHALLLHPLRLGTQIDLIFEDSIATYQKEKGLEELRTSKELQEESMLSVAKTCRWPLSDIYIDLVRGLRGLQTGGEVHDVFGKMLDPLGEKLDPFASSRTRLRERRKLREHGE